MRENNMNSFVKAVRQNPDSLTENLAPTFSTSLSACVDFFSKAGSMRTNPAGVIELFKAAVKEDPETALKVALWLRDVRGGAGERNSFRWIMTHMIEFPSRRKIYDKAVSQFIEKIPLLGRWDDLVFLIEGIVSSEKDPSDKEKQFLDLASDKIREGLNSKDGLCAKWMPRQGKVAGFLRSKFGLSPKFYRKLLVSLSETVEQKMCSNRWDQIDFSKVPSIAGFRYQKAFEAHQKERYLEFVQKAEAGEEKINASALYPHLVAKLVLGDSGYNDSIVNAMWDALPDYAGAANIMPIIDMSGSMESFIDSSKTKAMHVSVGLGVYCATKNSGPFRNTYIVFSQNSEMLSFSETDSVASKMHKVYRTGCWGMNTNLQKAFDKILKTGIDNKVPDEEMPKVLLVISDMEFDDAVRSDMDKNVTNFQVIKRKYEAVGYSLPKIIFWNVAARNIHNSPVRFDQSGTALISGYSPAILKAVLNGDLERFDPYTVMMEAISDPRYQIEV